MSTATRSFTLWRGLTPAGLTHGSLLIRMMIRHEEDGWWAESPDLPGLSVAAIKPAVEYYIEETPGLQDRPLAWQITNEHVGPTEAWNEARTA
ncbi:MAG: hypothetical protein KDB83_09180 [Actinobacteria bacterium]|nr:hypothetical protein [Actinomycetota bacterium]